MKVKVKAEPKTSPPKTVVISRKKIQEHTGTTQVRISQNPKNSQDSKNLQNYADSDNIPETVPELRPVRRRISPPQEIPESKPINSQLKLKQQFGERSENTSNINQIKNIKHNITSNPDKQTPRKKLRLKKSVRIFLIVCLLAGISVPVVRAVQHIRTAEQPETPQAQDVQDTPELEESHEFLESLESGTDAITESESESEFETVPESTASVMKIDPDRPMIALTYDDGPAEDLSERILDTLETYNAHATFFLVGDNITEETEPILKREVALGCELGNHTLSHKNLEKLELEDAMSQLKQCDDKILQCTGVETTLVRPPYGAYNDAIRETDKRMFIYWSLDTSDWRREDPDEICDIVMEYIDDGDIILMHDIHEQSVEASEKLIPALIEAGYQLVTVSELIEYRDLQTEDGMVLFNVHPEGAFFNSLYGTVCDYELRKELDSYDEEAHHEAQSGSGENSGLLAKSPEQE